MHQVFVETASVFSGGARP